MPSARARALSTARARARSIALSARAAMPGGRRCAWRRSACYLAAATAYPVAMLAQVALAARLLLLLRGARSCSCRRWAPPTRASQNQHPTSVPHSTASVPSALPLPAPGPAAAPPPGPARAAGEEQAPSRAPDRAVRHRAPPPFTPRQPCGVGPPIRPCPEWRRPLLELLE